MISHREAVVQALVERLRSSGWFAAVRRSDPAALLQSELPAAVLIDGGDVAEALDPVTRVIRLRVTVDVAVRGADAAGAAGALAEARARVLEALSPADAALGAVVAAVHYDGMTDPERTSEAGGPPELAARLSFQVLYYERSDDPWL